MRLEVGSSADQSSTSQRHVAQTDRRAPDSRQSTTQVEFGAVRLLSKGTAIQYASEGIRCNSVHPGPIETQMLAEVYPDDDMRTQREDTIPLGRLGQMEDVAKAVLFLASDEASYITGSELVIDGGYTAM